MDEEIRNGWARASVRFDLDDADPGRLPSELQSRTKRTRAGTGLIIDVPNESDARLETLLSDVVRLLRQQASTLVALGARDVDLFLGWSPKSPQESCSMSAELIGLLAKLKASVVFDTYSE